MNNTITIKANQTPYNYLTRASAISLAENFAAKQSYKAKTKLVSSFAWDTVIAFIQKVNSDYGNKSEEGNFKDTTFSYIDISGANQTKASGVKVLVPTGQTTPVCNIYDLGGNVWEWTTEARADSTYPSPCRGSYYEDNCTLYSAGGRDSSKESPSVRIGFRITLFL